MIDEGLLHLRAGLCGILQDDEGFAPLHLRFVRNTDHAGAPDIGMFVQNGFHLNGIDIHPR